MNVVFFIMLLYTKQLWWLYKKTTLAIFILLIRVTIIYMEIKELKQDSRSNEQSRLYFILILQQFKCIIHFTLHLYLHVKTFRIHSEIRLFFCHDSPLLFFTQFILCVTLHILHFNVDRNVIFMAICFHFNGPINVLFIYLIKIYWQFDWFCD